jgi:hypothetical protein
LGAEAPDAEVLPGADEGLGAVASGDKAFAVAEGCALIAIGDGGSVAGSSAWPAGVSTSVPVMTMLSAA